MLERSVRSRMRGALVVAVLLLGRLGSAVPIRNDTTWRGAKVLNFISLPDPQECLSDDNRRVGVCQNPYECRIMNGESRGQCALGFGVCCVYTATCGGELSSNVGYFVSPGHPNALTPGSPHMVRDCRLRVLKSASEISQIRLDMVHFTLGQPNRRTGVCEQDKFTLRSGSNPRRLRMCGINTGQHFYYDVDGEEDSAEMVIRLAKDHVSRFWEIKYTTVYNTATCGGELSSNVGYFVSPGHPNALTPGSPHMVRDCRLRVLKSASEISQIRLDMVHFTLGQPNRRTGVCEQDKFTLRSGSNPRRLRMCGINTGQHFYYDVDGEEDSAEMVIRLAKDHVSRFWEIKVTQIEFKDRAPSGCLQYFTEEKGLVQTMNFAANGRHLADQDYNICIRQEEGMCSIVYEPCDENSFRIGPAMPQTLGAAPGGGSQGGLGSLFPSMIDALTGAVNPNQPNQLAGDPEPVVADEEEGSGFGGLNLFSLFGGRDARQMFLRECDDRIVMPCDSEDLIPVNQQAPGVCDLLHCGNSFCTPEDTEIGGPGPAKCSTLPFNIAVHFGPGLREENPEDNLGMCLRYTQQQCSR
ncbi:hypothetical protein B566_EDAN009622 [Ephemera danica]|nr:hypothetical protein B566_EDAN009622 [Ephemera danica]